MGLNRSRGRDRLRLVFPEPFYPYAFMREGRPTGLALDLLAEVLAGEGIEADFAGLDMDGVEAELKSGAAQGAAVAGVTRERREWLDFSAPLCRSEAGLFGLRRKPARFSLDDYARRTISTPGRGPLADFIRARAPEVILLLVDDYRAALNAVINGKAEAAALNTPVGRELVEAEFPGRFRIPDRPILVIDLAAAAPKGKNQDLIAAVNRGLQKTAADGILRRLMKKWRL